MDLISSIQSLKLTLRRPPTLSELAIECYGNKLTATIRQMSRKLQTYATNQGIEFSKLICTDSKQYKLQPQVKMAFKALSRNLGRSPSPSEMIEYLYKNFELRIDNQMLQKILRNIRNNFRGQKKILWSTHSVSYKYSDQQLETAYKAAQMKLYKKFPGRLRLYPTSRQVAECLEVGAAETLSLAKVIFSRFSDSVYLESRRKRGLRPLTLASDDLSFVAATLKGLRKLHYRSQPILMSQLTATVQGLLSSKKIAGLSDYLTHVISRLNSGYRYRVPGASAKQETQEIVVLRQRESGLYDRDLIGLFESLRAPSSDVCHTELSEAVSKLYPLVSADYLTDHLKRLNLRTSHLKPITFWVREELLLIDARWPVTLKELSAKIRRRFPNLSFSDKDVHGAVLSLRRHRADENDLIQAKVVPANLITGLPSFFKSLYRRKLIPKLDQVPARPGQSNRTAGMQDIESINRDRILNAQSPFLYFSDHSGLGPQLAMLYRFSPGLGESSVDLSLARDRVRLNSELAEKAEVFLGFPEIPDLRPVSRHERSNFDFTIKCWQALALFEAISASGLEISNRKTSPTLSHLLTRFEKRKDQLCLNLLQKAFSLGLLKESGLRGLKKSDLSSEDILKAFEGFVEKFLPKELEDYFKKLLKD